MQLQLQIKMNPSLYNKDPEQSELGQRIIQASITLIDEIGFEEFTFRKLAQSINTTEASVYRYFENKHRLLTYIVSWFWTWMEYQLVFYTNNVRDTERKLDTIIDLITFGLEDMFMSEYIDKEKLQHIIIAEGNKAYLTHHVEEDNKAHIFKPYKDLSHRMAEIFLEYAPDYAYPHSMASTLIETAHHQIYFKEHLPSLTDFGKARGMKELKDFLYDMLLTVLDKHK